MIKFVLFFVRKYFVKNFILKIKFKFKYKFKLFPINYK